MYIANEMSDGKNWIKGKDGKYTFAPKGPLKGEFRGRMINVETKKINLRNGAPNAKGSGIEYAWKNHGGAGANSKSQFSITKGQVKAILQRKDVIGSPIRQSGTSGNYIREVDVGQVVGNLPLNKGGTPTSIITVITDVKGNVVNTFPGALGRSATLP
ncbi:MAG: hypothetical protein NXI04_30065 [Planctomycetaceae bacterium]|nr:hypothetical protein [Planctomycetaceae bacterium]